MQARGSGQCRQRPQTPKLQVKSLRAGYSKKEILQGLSLTVKQGEIVALISPNGVGKSTLLKVIAGLLQPWEGSVWLDGEEATSLLAGFRRELWKPSSLAGWNKCDKFIFKIGGEELCLSL